MKRFAFLLALALSFAVLPQHGWAQAKPAAVLSSAEVDKAVPPSVYFSGQVATVQLRNAGGVRWAADKQSTFALVDTGGYSTAVRERYQFYILSDVALSIAGHTLAPGAYGAGFVEGNGLIVMDLGGNEIFHAPFQADANVKRPRPLQVVVGGSPRDFRLYLGRNFVSFSPAH